MRKINLSAAIIEAMMKKLPKQITKVLTVDEILFVVRQLPKASNDIEDKLFEVGDLLYDIRSAQVNAKEAFEHRRTVALKLMPDGVAEGVENTITAGKAFRALVKHQMKTIGAVYDLIDFVQREQEKAERKAEDAKLVKCGTCGNKYDPTETDEKPDLIRRPRGRRKAKAKRKGGRGR